MLDTLLDRFLSESHVIIQAPGIFGSAVLFTSLIAFAISAFHFDGLIAEQQATIGELQQDVSDLKGTVERYHLQTAQNRFSSMSNVELAQAANGMVHKLSDFDQKYLQQSNELEAKERSENAPLYHEAPSPEREAAFDKIWQKYVADSDALERQKDKEYEDDFKVDAVLLREEILARLPSDTITKAKSLVQGYYNLGFTDEIAYELRFLVKLLPADKPNKDTSSTFPLRDVLALIALAIFAVGYGSSVAARKIKKRMYRLMRLRRRLATPSDSA